jgi:hypothetical protein
MKQLYPYNDHEFALAIAPPKHVYMFEVDSDRSFILLDWAAADTTLFYLIRKGHDVVVRAVLFNPDGDQLDELLGPEMEEKTDPEIVDAMDNHGRKVL